MAFPIAMFQTFIGKGYFAGGLLTSGTQTNEIDGIEFSSEAAINPSAALSTARISLMGVNSFIKGYFGGGSTANYITEIDGIEFSSETAINPSVVLALARGRGAGVQWGAL